MYEFYESMGSQMPYRARRGSISGRTTPLNDYEGDILEENPQFKDRAPPKPVVNRRISLEWENFEEQKGISHDREKCATKLVAFAHRQATFVS